MSPRKAGSQKKHPAPPRRQLITVGKTKGIAKLCTRSAHSARRKHMPAAPYAWQREGHLPLMNLGPVSPK